MSVKKIIILFFFLGSHALHTMQRTKNFTIMLEPAGDAKHAGRELDSTHQALDCAAW